MKQKFTIDLEGIHSATELQAKLVDTLPLPADYGRNFDALYDVLTEFGADWEITFINATTLPPMFGQVCTDAMAETPGLEIKFA